MSENRQIRSFEDPYSPEGTDKQVHRFNHRHLTPLHSHHRGHLVYPVTGVLSLTTVQGSWIAPANRIAWVPAGAVHQHRAHGAVDMRLVYLDLNPAEQLPEHPAVLLMTPLAREAVLALTGGAAGEDTSRGPERRARLRQVLLDELGPSPEQPLHLPLPRDPRLRQVAALLAEDLSRPVTLEQIGRRIGVGERTLSRLCREELGMGYRQWRSQYRLHRAMVLLAEGRPVLRTGAECGWSTASTFSDAFKRLVGKTPGEYRRLAAGQDAGDSVLAPR